MSEAALAFSIFLSCAQASIAAIQSAQLHLPYQAKHKLVVEPNRFPDFHLYHLVRPPSAWSRLFLLAREQYSTDPKTPEQMMDFLSQRV